MLDRVEPGKIVVYAILPCDADACGWQWKGPLRQCQKYTRRLNIVHARKTSHIIIIIFEVTDAVGTDVLTGGSRSVDVTVAFRVSESIVTRYFSDLANRRPTLVAFSGERPRFSRDFRVVNASAAGQIDLSDGSQLIGRGGSPVYRCRCHEFRGHFGDSRDSEKQQRMTRSARAPIRSHFSVERPLCSTS
jgi:hypothetical protein